MIVYLSGPMTGRKRFNKEAFDLAAGLLTAAGHVVLNPASLPPGLSDEAYMDIDLAMVRASEAVVTLPGWRRSAGAMAEVCYAKRIGRQVMELRDLLGPALTPELRVLLLGRRCPRGEEWAA